MSQILPQLWLSGAREAYDSQWLGRHHITHIVNCATELSNQFPGRFKYLHLRMSDHPMQILYPSVEFAARFIQAAIRDGGVVLVHCAAGVSRSVSTVVYYLMTRHGMTHSQALMHVIDRRPHANPNVGFLAQIRNFYTLEYPRTQRMTYRV